MLEEEDFTYHEEFVSCGLLKMSKGSETQLSESVKSLKEVVEMDKTSIQNQVFEIADDRRKVILYIQLKKSYFE